MNREVTQFESFRGTAFRFLLALSLYVGWVSSIPPVRACASLAISHSCGAPTFEIDYISHEREQMSKFSARAEFEMRGPPFSRPSVRRWTMKLAGGGATIAAYRPRGPPR